MSTLTKATPSRIGWTLAALIAAALSSSAALAQDKAETKLIPGVLTASVTFATDYTFRGISQTDSGPAIQGSIDWSYPFQKEIGVYLGIFGSNVDFNDGDEANIEVDFYGGLKGEVAGFAWQVGGIYYKYPRAEIAGIRYDYFELGLKLGYDFGFANLVGSYNYSPDYFFESGDGHYFAADLTVPLEFLPYDIALLGHVGHQSIDNNARFGAPDYTDWMLGITGKLEGFTLTLAYVDTDLSRGECFPGTSLAKTCESRVVFSVSKTF